MSKQQLLENGLCLNESNVLASIHEISGKQTMSLVPAPVFLLIHKLDTKFAEGFCLI